MTAVENARTLSASRGRSQIALASRSMQALVRMGDRFAAEKTFSGTKIGVCLHLTKETAVLVRALAAGGATVSLCGCNSFSTQDDVCAALKDEGVDVHARHGCSSEEYHAFLKSVAQAGNHIIIDGAFSGAAAALPHALAPLTPPPPQTAPTSRPPCTRSAGRPRRRARAAPSRPPPGASACATWPRPASSGGRW